ncbi:glycosyltransferase family 4 protein [Helicobacter himalayensis]|uniref:glycosyltransferase family 4 protein n=1 Tax=Helicobacter himalayensis TaxID=1591088 RepID=UPI003D6F4946
MANLCAHTRLSTELWEEENLEAKGQYKLLHIASDSVRGGAESVFRNTIQQTSESNLYSIYIASCDELKNLPQNINDTHFCRLDDWGNYPKPLGAIKYIFNFKNYRLLKSFLLRTKPDIIHVQNYLSRLSPSILFAIRHYKRHFPNIRIVYTEHGFGACPNGGFYNYAQKSICTRCIGKSKFQIALRNCDRRGRIYSVLKALRVPFYLGVFLDMRKLFDRIIFVSSFQMQKHIEDSWEKSKLAIVPNPIEMRFLNKQVSLSDKCDFVVFFGRLSPEKNVGLLIEAFAKVRENPKFSNYRLLIIGDGDDRESCENLARTLFSKSAHINNTRSCRDTLLPYTFLGQKSPQEIREILKTAKLSALPSLWYETFGLVLVESILAGAIPIASKLGAMEETIEKYYGFSFEFSEPARNANNVENLQVLLCNVLENYEDIFNDFKTKREQILQNLHNAEFLKNLIKVYETPSGGGGQ